MEEPRKNLGREEKTSLLWIVVMLNMVFADVLGFMLPGSLQEILTGKPDGLSITQPLLLVFALLLEIPIAMVFLSRILKRGLNRILNTAAAVVTSIFVIGGGSLTLHYFFFGGVEVACMAAIVVISWRVKA
jgi:hypothetical protein